MIGHDPFFAGEFLDRSRITPSVEPQPTRVGRRFRADEFGGAISVTAAFILRPAFLDHHTPDVRVGEFVADKGAVFVVFVRRRSEDVTENAGHGPAGRCRCRCS
jgi:hypothetical protein